MSKARILKGLTPAQYHADPCERPSLSASVATTLVSQSPLHAWAQHTKLGNCSPDDPTEAMDLGTLIHTLVLGAGMPIATLPYDDWRTKEARAARDQARAEGLVPVKAKDYDAARTTAERITAGLKERGIVLDGDSEVVIEWEEDGVLCRSMLDHLVVTNDGATIFDLKTVSSANPKGLGKTFIDRGHDLQHAAYVSAVEHLYPQLVGRVGMKFVYAETGSPFDLLVLPPGGVLREVGAMRWRKSVDLWRRCLEANSWPGYSATQIDGPPWAVAMLEAEALGCD